MESAQNNEKGRRAGKQENYTKYSRKVLRDGRTEAKQ
jgi:hypothetical protein